MWFPSWLRSLRSTAETVRPRRRKQPPSRRARPALEPLEDRCLLSAGQLDPTFGVGGKVITDVQGPTNTGANAVTVEQTDGKVVVVGSNNVHIGVARYTATLRVFPQNSS